MPDADRLIVVSNRLPVALRREGDSWSVKRTTGGLATAMDPILRRAGGLWIGWSGADEPPSESAIESLRSQSCIAVDLPADLAAKFCEGYSNGTLWPWAAPSVRAARRLYRPPAIRILVPLWIEGMPGFPLKVATPA